MSAFSRERLARKSDVVAAESEIEGDLAHTGTEAGFFGTTPVTQRAAITQTYSTADRTHAARTAAALTVTDGAGTNDGTIGAITADASVIAAIQELAAMINAVRVDGLDTAQLVNAIVDDQQALGFVDS